MKQITFNWTSNSQEWKIFEEFLISESLKFFVSDADVVVVSVDDNDSVHAIHYRYAKWLKANENDMTINSSADGSNYHC